MKKLSLILIVSLFVLNTSFGTSYNSDPKIFITELVDDAISKLSDKNTSKEEKENFIAEIALENVDIKALSLYTLGDLRKSTDQISLNKYQKIFEKYFLKSLTSRLTDYSSNKFEIMSADKKSSNYTMVKSKIVTSENNQ